MSKEYYTVQDIIKKYDSLSNKYKENVLWNALEYMKQFNGRTKWYCVARAMGFDNDTGDDNEYYKIK